jgi:hypothetical protein
MCPARAPTAFLGAGGCLHYRRTRKTLSTPPFEKSTNTRVGLSLIRRKFDIAMAWSVDRLGRSLQDLIGFLSELHSLGIDLALHQQGIDTTTPAGKAMGVQGRPERHGWLGRHGFSSRCVSCLTSGQRAICERPGRLNRAAKGTHMRKTNGPESPSRLLSQWPGRWSRLPDRKS